MLTLAAAACSGPAEAPAPPAMLITSAEDPFGDAVRKRVTRATIAAYDALEPRFGRLSSMPYAIPAEKRAALIATLEHDLPPGWSRVDLPGVRPDHSELRAYAAGKALFALLVVEPGQGTLMPVMILRNDAASKTR
ncbi:hypothetical protein [Sphingomonas sp. MS122]|uniref:hypothetical protein n=1 Tax=Sphingomonas sp. MS122 TaxID=3412683 RepID=UPI003C2D8C5D